MNSKYSSLIDYSMELRNSIKKVDNVILWSKPPKQMGSFKVTLQSISDIFDNIKKVQELQGKMKKLPTMDTEAKQENRSARKAADQISSIKSELSDIYSKLQDEFSKQMKIAGKQCREVGRLITDKKDKEQFKSSCRDFELMAYEAEYEKHRIPFVEKQTTEERIQDPIRREHKEKEEKINRLSELKLENNDKLELALSELTTVLALTPTDSLSNEVKSEVAQIRKVLPPKTMSITKENLEKLRHSSHLLLDLEQISDILKTTYGFNGKDGRLQKINKRLENLKTLLAQAIKEEQANRAGVKQEQDNLQRKVDYATDAVKTYGDILDGNQRLEQEQIRIGNETHGLYAETERLKADEKKVSKEMHEIQKKPVDRQDWKDGLKVDQLHERAKNDREMIKDNETYMVDKMYEKPVFTLPPEYTNMKKKLQSMSSLYQMQMTQQLSNGGASR